MATGTQGQWGHRYRAGDTGTHGRVAICPLSLPRHPKTSPSRVAPTTPIPKTKEKKEKGIFWTMQAGSKADLWPAFEWHFNGAGAERLPCARRIGTPAPRFYSPAKSRLTLAEQTEVLSRV